MKKEIKNNEEVKEVQCGSQASDMSAWLIQCNEKLEAEVKTEKSVKKVANAVLGVANMAR